MISFKHRFHGHNGLRSVYSRGKAVRSQLIALKFVQNPKANGYRCAVIVSKKVSKSAVKRNRIRRRVYEIVRKSSEDFLFPADLVFTVYSDSLTDLPAAELEAVVSKLLDQAKITTSD